MNSDAVKVIKDSICKLADEPLWETLTDECRRFSVGCASVYGNQIAELFNKMKSGDEFMVGNYVVVPTTNIGNGCTCMVVVTYGLNKVKTISYQSIINVLVYEKTQEESYFVIVDEDEYEYEGISLYKV